MEGDVYSALREAVQEEAEEEWLRHVPAVHLSSPPQVQTSPPLVLSSLPQVQTSPPLVLSSLPQHGLPGQERGHPQSLSTLLRPRSVERDLMLCPDLCLEDFVS